LESIQVSKGTSSVVNGYESTTGQINLEFKKPDNTEALFVNLFGADDGRIEANVTSAAPVVGKRLWMGLMLHGSTEQTEHDANRDGFMDMPKTKLFNIYNRWIYDNHEKGIESRTDVKFLYDERDGGQTQAALPPNSGRGYQTHIKNQNFKVSNKTGFSFGKREGQSVGIINSFTYHELNSAYGNNEYSGKQNTFYSNVLVSSYFANTSHKYVVGGSFLYDWFDEWDDGKWVVSPHPPQSSLSWLLREEIVPGAFAQYTYSYCDKMMVIIGLRGDYHNRFGMLFTPRTNVKYNFSDHIIFRVSAGRGFRSPNVISENIGYLASSKLLNIHSIKDLDIEKAWNYGANLTFYIPIPGNETMTISIDYYRTDFNNQAIVDMEYDRRQIFFYNLQGKSYANAWQIDVNTTPFKGFDIYAAWRLNDTKITYSMNDQRFFTDKPLTNKYRGLINLSYATNFEKWKFDVTAQFNGSSRLPSLSGYHAAKEW
jgi:outer membrane receptor for ferrienterochelin and colicin